MRSVAVLDMGMVVRSLNECAAEVLLEFLARAGRLVGDRIKSPTRRITRCMGSLAGKWGHYENLWLMITRGVWHQARLGCSRRLSVVPAPERVLSAKSLKRNVPVLGKHDPHPNTCCRFFEDRVHI